MDPFNQLPCSLSLVWKERKKKKWWKGWTVKSRLGNELLVIYSGCRGCQCERGWPFINVRRVDGDGTQCEASHGPCGSAAPSGDAKCGFEIKTWLCGRDVFCARKNACFTCGDCIKQLSHRSKLQVDCE